MARFLNKKQDVIDFKLTSYGKHLLGRGNFKPIYYAFFDDNILYDSQYAGLAEVQNETRKRIKEETQYLEGLTLFRDLEEINNRDGVGEINFFTVDIEPSLESPRKDIFRFDQVLGDAYLQGGAQVAPAWKVVSLHNKILSSSFLDAQNNSRVPQLHLTASYTLRTMTAESYYNDSYNSIEPRDFELATTEFIDKKIIFLERDDSLFYIEEMNTELLTKNFEIEVFEFSDKVVGEEFQHLKRKYFPKIPPQIIDGYMTMPTNADESLPEETVEGSYLDRDDIGSTLSPQDVKYYFDLVLDADIPSYYACKAASNFNKDSYYVDLDFNCDNPGDEEDLLFDIYGSVSEAEICLD